MSNEQKKCIGFTRKEEPCKNYPLKGEQFCGKHHPSKLQRKISNYKVTIIVQSLALLYFIISMAYSCNSEKNIRADIRENSLAERILANKYNPLSTQSLLTEVINLMNNDPDFKKEIVISGGDVKIKTILSNENNIQIDFTNDISQSKYENFLMSGWKQYHIDSNEYEMIFFLKNGIKVDSINNQNMIFSRNFPELAPLNISTIDPTKEYLCTSILDIQIDSVTNNKVYLSNSNQNNIFKTNLLFDLESKTISFDQIDGISIDTTSSFYSIDQAISYYEFQLALLQNAKIHIRSAFTGEKIYTSAPFIPHNIDSWRSSENINSILKQLRHLKKKQNN